MGNHTQLYALLGAELGASGMLSKPSTNWATRPASGEILHTKCCSQVHIFLQHWGTVKRTGERLLTATGRTTAYGTRRSFTVMYELLEANEKARHLEA